MEKPAAAEITTRPLPGPAEAQPGEPPPEQQPKVQTNS
jgi:hypothetical protein